MISPAQKIIVGLKILGGSARDGLVFFGREGDAQGVGNSAGNVLLEIQNVLHFPVIWLSPNRVTCPHLHHLCSDSQAIAEVDGAPSEHLFSTNLSSDFGSHRRLVAKSCYDGARKDFKAFDLG
jgi:hypothetical protein